ncbi:MAG: hypothetical protein LC749_11590 [Actinobacteria bacterium]|nr:hypothetical protein [Actinomycetota bacterium]
MPIREGIGIGCVSTDLDEPGRQLEAATGHLLGVRENEDSNPSETDTNLVLGREGAEKADWLVDAQSVARGDR